MNNIFKKYKSLIVTLVMASSAVNGMAQDYQLPKPKVMTVDKSISTSVANQMETVARKYAAFWDTGKVEFAQFALHDNFKDLNLPPGRKQGKQGPMDASVHFRELVPDLRCAIEEMNIIGNKVILRLAFTGYFSGKMGEIKGQGQLISFKAVDMYTFKDGQIFTNWHLEDMQTLTKQLKSEPTVSNTKSYWPNGARLVVSFSMQFETGGQPKGAESPFSGNPLPKGSPDLPAKSWYRYGATEGIYRMLRLWKKHDIKVTSHIVGQAAVKYPKVAKAIANGGHEVAAHGMAWEDQWSMTYEQEKKFIKDGIDVVKKITGQRGIGYNCNWLRRSPNTLKILQELGFTYHIDDLSRDEPFITKVRGKDFVVVPYTLRNNDIVNVQGKNWSPDQFSTQLKAEFDQLYAEGKTSRKMMSVSLHDRIGGSPAMIKVVDEFIQYAKSHKGVVFMRKDKIAALVLNDKNTRIDNSELEFNKDK